MSKLAPKLALSPCPALDACLRGRFDEGERLLRTLGDPRDPRVRFNLGWHNLRHGRFKQGMEGMAAGRWIGVFGSPPIGTGKPIFDRRAHDAYGKVVLLHSEGGLGDHIINARFAVKFAEIGASVVLSCARSLMSLLSRVPGVQAVVETQGARYVFHDYWVPAMSAPLALNMYEKEDLMVGTYIRPKRIVQHPNNSWLRKIASNPRMKVGVRWRGNPEFEHEQHRRFDPTPMFELAEKFPNISFYSLQRDTGADDLPKDSRIVDLQDRLVNWEVTATVVSCLDLVITSDTSVAHLSAAMGVPTWVILPIMPYYVWVSKEAWYGDHVKMISQEQYGRWDSCFNQAERLLLNWGDPK